MEKSKKCSGCKQEKSLTNYYKNRLTLDGHSNYCVDCTRENSKRYFQRKKEKIAKAENDNLIKMVMLNNYTNDTDSTNAENLMKILMIEKMLKNVMDELDNITKNYTKPEIMSVM